MSHAKERKEKNCLNCNAVVAGRFCSVCGQENIDTHETFGHLAGHFIGDIFHFDGQFLSTAKYLLFKPGFLTHEYVRGRRASYLNPIKMYFFVSAVFFLFFISVNQQGEVKVAGNPLIVVNETEVQNTADIIAKLKSDSIELVQLTKMNKISSPMIKKQILDKAGELSADIKTLQKDSTHKKEIYNRHVNPTLFGENPYDSRGEYDSIQKALPPEKQDGWLARTAMHRNIDVAEKFRQNGSEAVTELQEGLLHRLPQALFISLPLFALVLQLLYIRRRNFLYVNHIIYTLHLYCALFVFMFLSVLLGMLADLPGVGWLQWLNYAVVLYATYYTFRALYVYYGQGIGKTLLKWILLNLVAFIMMMGLVVLLFFFAFYTL